MPQWPSTSPRSKNAHTSKLAHAAPAVVAPKLPPAVAEGVVAVAEAALQLHPRPEATA